MEDKEVLTPLAHGCDTAASKREKFLSPFSQFKQLNKGAKQLRYLGLQNRQV